MTTQESVQKSRITTENTPVPVTANRSVTGNERMLALSDGVFAIVITLLVLEIRMPEIPPSELLEALQHLLPDIISHAISFIILGIYWVGHHNMFLHIQRHDRPLLWLNILFLLCVASMPFPTGLLIRYGQQQIAVIIYAGTLAAAGLVLALIWWYVTHNRRLVNEQMESTFIAVVFRRVLIAPTVYLAAIFVSAISISAAKLLFVIIAVIYIIPNPMDRHHHQMLHGQPRTQE